MTHGVAKCTPRPRTLKYYSQIYIPHPYHRQRTMKQMHFSDIWDWLNTKPTQRMQIIGNAKRRAEVIKFKDSCNMTCTA